MAWLTPCRGLAQAVWERVASAGMRETTILVHVLPRAKGRRTVQINCTSFRWASVSRIVKIFEPTFLLEVTPPTIAALPLVFRPPVTDTHRQYGRWRLQGRGDGLETPARVY